MMMAAQQFTGATPHTFTSKHYDCDIAIEQQQCTVV